MRRVLFCALILAVGASVAHADGCFVWSSSYLDIQQPRQKALIVHADGVEELVLSAQFEGAGEDFAWLVPLPSPPEIRLVERETFAMLDSATRVPDRGKSSSYGYAFSKADDERAVELAQYVADVFDIAVFTDGDGEGLSGWLAERGYQLPGNAGPILDDYIGRGWSIAAVSIAPTAEGVDAALVETVPSGTVRPVLFRFASEEPVYPLRLGAAMGRPVDVKLYVVAEEPLVCRDAGDVDWEIGVFGRLTSDEFELPDHLAHYPGTSVPLDTLYYVTGVARRFFGGGDAAPLTRLSATFAPGQMTDLAFAPYDPYAELASSDLDRRIQAATYLGARPNRADVAPLIEMMWASNAHLIDQDDAMQFFWAEGYYPEQDLVAALWALGRIDAAESVEEVTRWARMDNARCALEALATLGKLDQKAATDLAAGILAGARSQLPDCDEERAIAVWAKNMLIAHGGAEHAPVLAQSVAERYDPETWRSYIPQTVDLGLFSLLAAVACGDEDATVELRTRMKEVAIELGKPGRPGLVGNYPTAVTYGAAILQSWYGTEGKVIRAVETHFADRPDLRHALFSWLSRHPEIGGTLDGIRAVMISKLDDLDEQDAILVRKIWDHALEQPRRMRVRFRDAHAPTDTVTYNVDAVAAAYTLGVHGRAADLLDCWHDVGWDDPDLKGELALALCLTDDPAGVPAVLEYVRTVWDRNAAVPSLAEAVAREFVPPYDWPSGAPLDLRYRAQVIANYIIEHAWDEVAVLVADEGLHPYLRLFWALDPLAWWDHPSEQLVMQLEALRPLVESERMHERIDWTLERTRRTMALLAR
jgi:hypothetical protein